LTPPWHSCVGSAMRMPRWWS